MKFNAHLLQSQSNMGDIGLGQTEVPITDTDNWNDEGDSVKSVGSSRSIITNTDPMVHDIYYRNAFIGRIFSLKPVYQSGTLAYSYDNFFDGQQDLHPLVDPHEIPTMGQIADYMLKPAATLADSWFRGGLMPRYVGDHINGTDQLKTLINAYPDYVTPIGSSSYNWLYQYDLTQKIKYVLDRIIGDGVDGTNRFPIQVKNLWAESITTTGTVTENLNTNEFTAGNEGLPTINEIFQVGKVSGGDDNNWKYVKLWYSHNNISGAKATGIIGEFHSGSDYISDINGSDFTFIDVDRYYLRASDGKRNFNPGPFMHYLRADPYGYPQFVMYDDHTATLIHGVITQDSKILTTRMSEKVDVILSNSNEFSIAGIYGDTPAFSLDNNQLTTSWRRLRFINSTFDKSWGLRNLKDTGSYKWAENIKLPTKSGYANYMAKSDNTYTSYTDPDYGPVNIGEAAFLISDSSETVQSVGSKTPIPATDYYSIFKFIAYNAPSATPPGCLIGSTINGAFFASKGYSAPKFAYLPTMHTDGEFIVQNPNTMQTINSKLKIGSVIIDGIAEIISCDTAGDTTLDNLRKAVNGGGAMLQTYEWPFPANSSGDGTGSIYSDLITYSGVDTFDNKKIYGEGVTLAYDGVNPNTGALYALLKKGVYKIHVEACGYRPGAGSPSDAILGQVGCAIILKDHDDIALCVTRSYGSKPTAYAMSNGWCTASCDYILKMGDGVSIKNYQNGGTPIPNDTSDDMKVYFGQQRVSIQSWHYTVTIERIGEL